MSRTWPDLAVLAVLVGVDDLGSLGAAARQEGMAQPNASRAVRRLEGELGVPLLRRGPRGSVLTPQGTVVVHWAREVLADAGRLLDAAEALRGARRDELAVSASMTVAEHLVPAWLAELRRHHADLRIHLLVHNSARSSSWSRRAPATSGSWSRPRCRAVSTAAPWVRTASSSWSPPPIRGPGGAGRLVRDELAGTPLVVREPGSGTRTTLDDALRDLTRAEPLLELASGAAVRASVLAGRGPAVVSILAVGEQVEAAPCGSSRWRGRP